MGHSISEQVNSGRVPTDFHLRGNRIGQTTLAGELARRTGLPWHSVDELTWEPGWVPVADAEQRARIGAACAKEQWILDTAYSKWLDIPLARAELILALDYPRWLSLGRLLRRTAKRIVSKEMVCNGNVETLRQALGNDSIIAWHFRSFRRKKARFRTWETDRSGPDVIRFRWPGESENWLQTLGG